MNRLSLSLALALGGLAVFQSSLPAQTVSPKNRIALVMGVWSYSDPSFPALGGIESEVKSMSTKLTDLGFQVTLVKNPSLSEAKTAVDAFNASLKARKAWGCFYFCGHGCVHEGKNFLLPKSAHLGRLADVEDEALPVQRVLNGMEDAGSELCMVFLDCHPGKLGNAAEGLAPMQARGVFIGSAVAQPVTSGAVKEGSAYSEALIENLGSPGLTLDSMHNRVTKRVKELTGGKENPSKYSGLDKDFVLIRKDKTAAQNLAAVKKPGLPPPSSTAPLPASVPNVAEIRAALLRGDDSYKLIRDELDHQCTKAEARFINHTIHDAIERGAPLHNEDLPRDCYRVYEEAAHTILQKVQSAAARNFLNKALAKARQDDKAPEKCWIVRGAFDAMKGVHGQGE